MLVDAVVVDICQDDITVCALRCSTAEVRKILLQNTARASRGEQDQVGLVLLILASDVVDNLILRATSKHVAVDNTGSDWRKVPLPLKHAPHDIEVVVTQGRVHDGMHVLEGGRNTQCANVRWAAVHPICQLHAASQPVATSLTRCWHRCLVQPWHCWKGSGECCTCTARCPARTRLLCSCECYCCPRDQHACKTTCKGRHPLIVQGSRSCE
mmetsp:Transcript_42285/g.76653  ORF Transcript_42285/g.76653 Transcript_42285/m.76653 type:complete len:212 (-) Transcript_42285:209-844(-)